MRPLPARGDARRWAADASMVLGAAMVVWSGAIHLHLWSAGYRSLPTIGWLFLFQAITAFVVGPAVAVTRRVLVAGAGALLLASTEMGLVWSVERGLFGFQDRYSAPFATESLGVETAGVVVLVVACVLARRHR